MFSLLFTNVVKFIYIFWQNLKWVLRIRNSLYFYNNKKHKTKNFSLTIDIRKNQYFLELQQILINNFKDQHFIMVTRTKLYQLQKIILFINQRYTKVKMNNKFM